MAFLRCRKGSRFWHACFYVPAASGKWKLVTHSTKIEVAPAGSISEKDAQRLLSSGMEKEKVEALREAGMSANDARKLAQKVADAWEAAAKKGWTVSHIRKVIGELAVEVTGEEMSSPTVRVWFGDFIAGLSRKGKSVATVRNYRNAANRFYAFLGEKVDWSMERVTPRIMNDYMLELSGLFAVKTVKKEFGMVCAMFNSAVRLGMLDRCPGMGVELPREKKVEFGRTARRGFTLEELKRVLERCDEEWRSMVLCALYLGGQRLGDVAMLRWDAVDWDKRMVRFMTQKTSREMVVPMVPALEEVLRERLSACGADAVFVHPIRAEIYKRSGSSRLSTEFSGMLFDAGLIDRDPRLAGKRYKKLTPVREGKRRVKNELSFHSLRYTVTTMLHDAGVVPAMVQEIVGHSSAQVHAGYIKFGPEATEKALEKLPEL
ncbi:tyrosine-type recombinase/integrase [Akkermansia massiliensis]